MLKPVCFMIMPYGRKPSQVEAGRGPAEIDFNALWDRAYVPVIESLGYTPVRADQDTGALIITQMFERLYFADLVLADMTIPNGNVYYEVGIRHAARQSGCVLLAADWSRQLFDVTQMRTIPYPLPEGDISEATTRGIASAVTGLIRKWASMTSPMGESIKGFPNAVREADASAMRDKMDALASFQGRVRAVRAFPQAERMKQALALAAEFGGGPIIATVALALVRLLRDCVDRRKDWGDVVRFIESLPPDLAREPGFEEHRAFALGQVGQPVDAIGAVEALMQRSGPTSESLGILGGRYKRLMDQAATDNSRAGYRNRAIEAYERGMDLDLNNYYCASNLARLYRARGNDGDEARAETAIAITVAACERARRRGAADDWLCATLLAAAFDQGRVQAAATYAGELIASDPTGWKLDSLRPDLETALAQSTDPVQRDALTRIYETLPPQADRDAAHAGATVPAAMGR